jgi:hypothetical protein
MTLGAPHDARSPRHTDPANDTAPTPPAVHVLVGFQSLLLVVFLGGLIGGLAFQDEIRESFRATINHDLAKSLAARVSFAEEAVATPLAARHLAPHQIEGIREEIVLYRKDPEAYVAYLTGGSAPALDQSDQLEASSGNPLKRAFLEQVIGWRASVKSRFDSSFAKIGRDICIFLGSNVVASIVALILATRVRRRHPRALRLSILLTVAIGLSALSYVDRNWLYAFLRNDWAVFGYPLMLVLSFVWLWLTFPHQPDAK